MPGSGGARSVGIYGALGTALRAGRERRTIGYLDIIHPPAAERAGVAVIGSHAEAKRKVLATVRHEVDAHLLPLSDGIDPRGTTTERVATQGIHVDRAIVTAGGDAITSIDPGPSVVGRHLEHAAVVTNSA